MVIKTVNAQLKLYSTVRPIKKGSTAKLKCQETLNKVALEQLSRA